MKKINQYYLIAFLVLLNVVSFIQITGNDFINFDDNIYLTENPQIKAGISGATVKWAATTVVSSNWHPLTLISHALDWTLFGSHASGHHVMSLLFHIGAVILLFLFFNKTTNNIWASALVAALFSIHPLRVESVAWAAERKDVLSMLFGMGALYAYAYYVEKPQTTKYFLCLILFAFSLMAKPMLVTLPAVMLLMDYWPLNRWPKALPPKPALAEIPAPPLPAKKKEKKRKKDAVNKVAVTKAAAARTDMPFPLHPVLLEKVPFFVLSLISSILTVWAQNQGGAVASMEKVPLSDRISNALVSYVIYLGKMFWPADLAVFYPYQASLPAWQVAGSLLLLALITGAVIYTIKKCPFLFVGWFWYVGTLLPVIGLVQVGRQALADRYTYLPSIGIMLMLIWGILYLLPQEKIRKYVLAPAASLIIIVLAILTWQQSACWKNSYTLFNHALNATKDNYLAHTNLGIAFAADGQIDEAIAQYSEVLRIKPNDDIAHYNLANILMKQGANEEAITHYQETLRSNPAHSKAHNNLATCLKAQGRYDEAIDHYREALQTDPANPGIYFNLGLVFAEKGAWGKAAESFQRALYLNPGFEPASRALARARENEMKSQH